MKMKRPPWVKLPTGWIEAGGLKAFHWKKDEGSAGIAALMDLLVIAHHADPSTGRAVLTYEALRLATGLSGTKVANGLDVLEARELIGRAAGGRSGYQLFGYDPERGWAKLPARGLYAGDVVAAFSDFRLRRKAELDALKAYLAIVARRDRNRNRAYLTYDQFEDYAGIPKPRVKSALSVLTHSGLIYTDQVASNVNVDRVAHAYRPAHLDSYIHQGTKGRSDEAAFDQPALDESIET